MLTRRGVANDLPQPRHVLEGAVALLRQDRHELPLHPFERQPVGRHRLQLLVHRQPARLRARCARRTNVRSPSGFTPTRYGASETIALFCAATLRPPSASNARPSTFSRYARPTKRLRSRLSVAMPLVVGHRGRELFLIRLLAALSPIWKR